VAGDCSMRTESLCCSKSFFSFVVKLFSNVTNVFHIYRLCCKLNDNARNVEITIQLHRPI